MPVTGTPLKMHITIKKKTFYKKKAHAHMITLCYAATHTYTHKHTRYKTMLNTHVKDLYIQKRTRHETKNTHSERKQPLFHPHSDTQRGEKPNNKQLSNIRPTAGQQKETTL